MEVIINPGKKLEIAVENEVYLRYALRTKFVTLEDHYFHLIETYVKQYYQKGDILAICEKIISICQHRIIKREDLPIGFWAKFLSQFACQKNRGGFGVGMPINMQYAINKVGLFKVLLASVVGGIGKLFGKKGLFYRIVGREVSGLDGFYDGAWEAYRNIGIEIPLDSTRVCNEIREKFGISCMIVDANDFGQEILGKSDDIVFSDSILKKMIRDNPAGQLQELTPFILIRRKKDN
ncbi:MAG: F420-0--gamma-glutamyl ligase [Bacilli bacterium]|nr:F420-0--gamma-glutamyl ligase [Bacilli bacterium]